MRKYKDIYNVIIIFIHIYSEKTVIMKFTNVLRFAFCPLVRASLPHRLAGMAFNCLLFVGAGLLFQRQVLQGEWV